MTPRLVVAGNLILDDIVYQDGSTRLGQAGGAALYAALGASHWGIRVGVASVVGEDYPKRVLGRLEELGLDLGGVRRLPGPGLRIWLLYEGRRRQVVHRLESPGHAAMSPLPADLPRAWRADGYHLAPMPLPVQLEWLAALDRRRSRAVRVSLDLFELVREENLVAVRETLHRADVAFLGEDELLLDRALGSPRACLERLANPTSAAPDRLAHLVLKRGAQGGLAYDRKIGAFRAWSARADSVVDPTGAGDAFAGGMLAGLLHGRPLEQAFEHGVVAASFAMEAPGARGMLEASPQRFADRARDWFGWRAA